MKVYIYGLALLLVSLTACSLDPSGSDGGWYYHWNCNGDSECLTTNPTGEPTGDLDEGPVEVNCTQLMVFAAHFWGSAATNSCDQSSTAGGGGTGATYSIIYSGNGSTGGTVPVDPNMYASGQNFTVLGDTGHLTKACFTFTGWNSKTDGSGRAWGPGALIRMTAPGATLYATWPATICPD